MTREHIITQLTKLVDDIPVELHLNSKRTIELCVFLNSVIAYITEITEENKRLSERLAREAKCQYELATKIVDLNEKNKMLIADTVRMMQVSLKHTLAVNNCENYEILDYETTMETIDQIAKKIGGLK